LVSAPLLVGVSVTGPTTVGVMVNVCAVEEFKNVRVVAVETPPPDGAIVIEPLYSPFGVTVKFVETEFNAPPVGPLKVYVVADAAGATAVEVPDAVLIPAPLVAVTVQVYGVPLVSPLTTIGLAAPVFVCDPQVTV
jgi:hypothetical protein